MNEEGKRSGFPSDEDLKPSNLVSRSQLPKWLLDNEWIINWYRRPDLNHAQCLWSVFSLHNQSVNIWTHILGLVAVQVYTFYWFPSHITNSWGDATCHEFS